MPTRFQEVTSGFTGSKHQLERSYEVSDRCCMISRARNTRSYTTTRYQDGAAGPHGFGKPDQDGASGCHG